MNFDNKPEPSNYYESEDLEHQHDINEVPEQPYETLDYEIEQQLTTEDLAAELELDRFQEGLVPIESGDPDLETVIEVEKAIEEIKG